MRLLRPPEQMISADRIKAESFAKWLLTVGEGRNNSTPTTELPSGMFAMKAHVWLTTLQSCVCLSEERQWRI
jgi:hypothetical protein